MAIRDIEAFVRERALRYDPTLDINPGSPFDSAVVQPLVRRLGTDPFTVDMATFVTERLKQAYPDLAMDEGDAVVDLLVKPCVLLWDSFVREVQKIKQNLSFQDATTLTLEEAEALGANLFSERALGTYARGQVQVYFNQPQSLTITSVNYLTSRSGLRFFPTEPHSIRVDEMVLNRASDNTFFFNINAVAENPGIEYNIGPGEITTIADVPAAVRVTNTRRFLEGTRADTVEEYIEKTRGELTERSLVTLRGISAQLSRSFPEIRRLNVVGYGDPEMDRDVLVGSGYGPVLVSGTKGSVIDDGSYLVTSKHFTVSENVDFLNLIPQTSGIIGKYTLTIVGGVDDPAAEVFQDFTVIAIVDSKTLELDRETLAVGRNNLSWSLRRDELSLSKTPGGILFNNGPRGNVDISDGAVHVGGCTDIYIKGSALDEGTVSISAVGSDSFILSGTSISPVTLIFDSSPGFVVNDQVVGADVAVGSPLYDSYGDVANGEHILEVISGPNSSNLGTYRVIEVRRNLGQPIAFRTVPDATNALTAGSVDNEYSWRISNQISIDLSNPREVRVTASDLITSQGSNIVRSNINFADYAVSANDILEITTGPDVGKYIIQEAPLIPGFNKLRINTTLKHSWTGLGFSVYRSNASEAVNFPVIRVKSVELLDIANQPVGVTVPYANPVDVQSSSFQNAGDGIKHTIEGAQLGIISKAIEGGGFGNPAGATLSMSVLNINGTITPIATISFPANVALASVVTTINNALQPYDLGNTALQFDSARFAVRPVSAGVVFMDGTALPFFFGNAEPRTTADIRVPGITDWDALRPIVDYTTGFDTVRIEYGRNAGDYAGPFSGPASTGRYLASSTGTTSTALIVRDTTLLPTIRTRQFAPEDNVQIQLGTRSLGSARIYFMDPTTFEIHKDTKFYTDTENGRLVFVPDPSISRQVLPALPSNVPSTVTTLYGYSTVIDTSQNLLLSGVQAQDTLVIEYTPVTGTKVLANPVIDLVNKTFKFRIDNGPLLTVVFVRDDVSINLNEVTLTGVARQINDRAGLSIASITTANQLRFNSSEHLITIDPSGTANSLILGAVQNGQSVTFSNYTVTNRSPFAGTYTITDVDPTVLTVTPAMTEEIDPVFPFPNQFSSTYRITRTNTQRISTSQMAQNISAGGLYYFDVQLVSDGVGDIYNISDRTQLTVENFRSNGYYLINDNTDYTFSTLERPSVIVSNSILPDGVDDSPDNAILVSGQNMQITYEYSQLVADVQAYAISDIERVNVQNPLVRHLLPAYVYLSLRYSGGSVESVISTDLQNYLLNLYPYEPLESSDIQALLTRRGAESITNPVDIVALMHRIDRSIYAVRSENAVTISRLAAYIPNTLDIKRALT